MRPTKLYILLTFTAFFFAGSQSVFAQQATYTLTITKLGSGTGTVSTTPAGINCGSACVMSFPAGTNVSIAAIPANGSGFVGWEGDLSFSCKYGTIAFPPARPFYCSAVMDMDRAVTVTFEPTVPLIVNAVGPGEVLKSPGISSPTICSSSTCIINLLSNWGYTFMAKPNSGNIFTGWSGDCDGFLECGIIMQGPKTITAMFGPGPPTLTVVKTGTGQGKVTSTPAGIDCGDVCSASFPVGSSVRLSGAPEVNSVLNGISWDLTREEELLCLLAGGCTPNTYLMDRNRTVSADFEAKPAIVIVPGIMGSRLNRASNGEEVWPRVGGVGGMADSFQDDYLDDLQLSSSGEPIAGKEMGASDVIRVEPDIPIIGQAFYKSLIDSFIQEGYIEGQNLFVAPYDWRLNIQSSTRNLETRVRAAIRNSPSGKVNIIAHSMGGLLTKEYLDGLTDVSFLDKVVFLGVPNLGTARIFKVLNYGDDMDIAALRVGPLALKILNKNEIKKISQNMPAVYQLLPSREYINRRIAPGLPADYGSYVIDLRDGRKALTYEETKKFMKDAGRNETLLNLADQFHVNRDNVLLNTSSSTAFYNIVGCGVATTIAGFNIYEKRLGIPEFGLRLADGDGTVPRVSASSFANATRFYVPNSLTGATHSSLVQVSSTLTLIKNIFADKPYDPITGISLDVSTCTGGRSLEISAKSPVKLHVYDSQGRHTGPTADGDIELGIPGSDYFTIEDNSFAFVPEETTTRIELDATAAGTFDLHVETLNGSVTEEKVTYLNIPLASSSTTADMMFSGPTSILSLDSNGDGTQDVSYNPSAALSGAQAQDTNPPVISAYFPSEIFFNDERIITFSVTDDLSGVSALTATLDDVPISSGDRVLFSRVGEHILKIQTIDRAGNPSMKVLPFKVTYGFGGFFPPLDSSFNVLKKGDTAWVRFQLTDVSGAFISTATPKLYISQVPPEYTLPPWGESGSSNGDDVPDLALGGSSNGDDVPLPIGSSSNGEDIPQCSDGSDNDGDAKVDMQDAACHRDGNVFNPSSYDPSRASENSRPRITRLGSNPAETVMGEVYIDPGVIAYDEEDGDITNKLVVRGLPLNTSALGSALVTYSVVDSQGVAAPEVTRLVYILGKENLVSPKLLSGGKSFRYDSKQNYYEAGLLTGSLSPRAWKLRVALDDGKSYPALLLVTDLQKLRIR